MYFNTSKSMNHTSLSFTKASEAKLHPPWLEIFLHKDASILSETVWPQHLFTEIATLSGKENGMNLLKDHAIFLEKLNKTP